MVAAHAKYDRHAKIVTEQVQKVLQDDTVFVRVCPATTAVIVTYNDCDNAFLKGDDYDKLIKLKPDAAFAFLHDRTG